MDDQPSFGRWLRHRRRLLDLTQDELAQRVACSVVTIRKIETDERRPSKQIAERLSDVLAIPPAEHSAFIRLARATPGTEAPALPQIPPPLAPSPPATATDAGRVVKGYVLCEPIGEGGFGVVYRAEQPLLGRDVAVKVILPQYANHPDFIRRFEAEAQLIARLEHPHIVPLYDYWREPDRAYLVMRYVRGGNLLVALQPGPLPLDAVARLLEQIGPALALAHRHGVIHRDLKPTNILLDTDGNAYVADFGIAKDLGAASPTDATQPELILGSPAYLSPEQIKDEPITPQTDIYSLGVLLYESLSGAPPFQSPTPAGLIQKHLSEPLPPLGQQRPDLPAALDAVLQKATAKQPAERYPDVLSLVGAFQGAVAPVRGMRAVGSGRATVDHEPVPTDQRAPPAVAEPPTLANPYKGLRAFAEADAADFFGRAALTQRLLERLAEEHALARFLAVVGPSGSGKSSVVRAGLLPAVRRGGLPGSEEWFIVELVPGAHPLEELEAALLRVAVNPPASLLEQLQADKRGLVRAVKRVLPPNETIELVLVIDQFEELFTLVDDEATRAQLLASLFAAVTDARSRLRVIVTLRADFYDRPLLYGDFSELVRERTEVVVPLTPAELEQAISGPAERVALALELGLASAIIHDVGEQPGALPLLQYALTELVERRVDHTLTMAAYQASGGVLAALGHRAEALYAGLDPVAQAETRQLFLRLVTLGDGVEDTRRRVLWAELASAAGDEGALERVLDRFGRYRLLTFDRDPLTRGPTVEVAHEALLRTWGRLRGWLEASREQLRVQRRLMLAATEWATAGQDPSFLASGARLAQFEALAAEGHLALTADEGAYLQASVAERDRQARAERERQARELELARESANRLRVLVGVLGLFLLVAGALAVLALNSRAAAVANFRRSEAERLAAEASTLLQTGGSTQAAALLAIRSLQTRYTPQGDFVLAAAALLEYPLQVFSGHTDAVVDVTFSPDGKYVLTSSSDTTARLWDAQSGQVLRVFPGHTDGLWGVAFSPDGRSVLTGGGPDHTARLWDAQTGQVLRTFAGHTGDVTGVAFSPDGNYVLTGSADRTARLWDVQTGAQLRTFAGHTGAVGDLTFSPDGEYVLTAGSDDRTARLWDAQTGAQLRTFAGHTDELWGVAFSPDGTSLLTGSFDTTARLWDTRTGQVLRTFAGHTGGVNLAAYSPDGKSVLTGSGDRTARLWNAATGQELRRFIGHTAPVLGVAFSPDGTSLLTGGYDFVARLWDVQLRAGERQFLGHTDFVNGVAFSPDGNYALTGSNDTTARLWEVQTGAALRTFAGHTDAVFAVAFSPDGKQVLTAGKDKTARLWDVRTGAELRRFTGHTDWISGVAFSPDGKQVLTASKDKTVRLWDAQTGAQLRTFTGHTGWVNNAVFAPDGKIVLTGSDDGTVRLWDAQTGQELRTIAGPSGVNRVAFSPDGRSVLAGYGKAKIARLWDTQSGAELRTFTGHSDIIIDVAFSPDGKYVLTGSDDKTARLWDAQTGSELRRFQGHIYRVNGVAFSPNGRYVLTGGSDNIARLWYTEYHATIGDLCRRLTRDFTDDERVKYNIPDKEPTCPQPGR